jgi:hypothetical protein
VRLAEIGTGQPIEPLDRVHGTRQRGRSGVFVQEFAPGRDTTSTRRPIGGVFTDAHVAESFGVSPDGTRLAIAAGRESRSLMLAEAVAGVR